MAISYGDVQVFQFLSQAIFKKLSQIFRKEYLIECFKDIKQDFIMKFESYYKLINANQTSEALAVPKITLTKKGLKLRIDLKSQEFLSSTSETLNLILTSMKTLKIC
jgi:hypothetical protein